MRGILDWFVLAMFAVALFLAWPWLKDDDEDGGAA